MTAATVSREADKLHDDCKENGSLLDDFLLGLKNCNVQNQTRSAVCSRIGTIWKRTQNASFSSIGDFTANGDSFEVLANLRPLVDVLNTTVMQLSECANQIVLNKKDLTMIETISQAQEVCTACESAMRIVYRLFDKVINPNIITALFKELSPILVTVSTTFASNGLFKSVQHKILDTIANVLIRVGEKSCGPHDSTLLAVVDPLMCFALAHHNVKVKNAAIAMWKATFAKATTLDYSENLKKVLVLVSRRHPVITPGFDAKRGGGTPAKSPAAKIMALLNEDSVDYVVVEQPAKKMKLTDHQKEQFTQHKDKITYMDEDSSMGGSNLIKRLDSAFDLDSSRTGTNSKDQKPVDHLVEKVVVSAESKYDVEKPQASEPKTRKSARHLNFENFSPSSESSSKNGDEKEMTSIQEPVRMEKLDDDVQTERQADSVVPSESSDALNDPAEVSDTDSASKDASSETGKVSRKSHSRKSTPTKYVGRPKRKSHNGKDVVEKDVVASADQPKPTKKRRMRKSSSHSADKDEDSMDSKSDTNSAEISVKTDVTVRQEETISEPSMKTPEKVAPVVDVMSMTTPQRTPSVLRVMGSTPGILKKIGSPSTAEKKRMRVHFNGLDVRSEENTEEPIAETTASEPTSAIETVITAPQQLMGPPSSSKKLTEPVCIEGIDCAEPVTRLVPKLVPILNGCPLLTKALRQVGVTTVGDLARLSPVEVSKLPLRIPRIATVQKTIRNFLATLEDSGTSESVDNTSEISVNVFSSEARNEDSTEVEMDQRNQKAFDCSLSPILSVETNSEETAQGLSICNLKRNMSSIMASLENLSTAVDSMNTNEIRAIFCDSLKTVELAVQLHKKVGGSILCNSSNA